MVAQCRKMNSRPDWGHGLPEGLLAAIAKAGGCNEMKAMRGVNNNWKAEFESSISSISFCDSDDDAIDGPPLPADGTLRVRFPALARLDLERARMPQASWSLLAGLKNLTSLRLGVGYHKRDCCEEDELAKVLTDEGLEHLQGLPLTCLGLDGIEGLTEEGLACLKGMPLRTLSFTDGYFTDEMYSCLKGMPLTRLKLGIFGYGGSEVGDSGMLNLLGMPLTVLDLNRSTNVTNAGFDNLRGMPLTDLDIARCRSLTSLDFLLGMPLRRLVLSDLDLNDDHLEVLRGMPLEKLDLLNNRQITDVGLSYLRGLPLKRLNIAGCPNLTEVGFHHFQGMPLEVIFVYNEKYSGNEDYAGVQSDDLRELVGNLLPADMKVTRDPDEPV